MLAYPHRERCGSWFCPYCAQVLSRKLRIRLDVAAENLKGKGYHFILATLEFDPSRFGSPAAALEAAKRGRWVAECMRKWAAARGVGKLHYLVRVEVHKSGWPHFHLVIAIPDRFRVRLPDRAMGRAGELADWWLHGFSDLRVYGESAGGYAGKGASRYVLKAACESGGFLERLPGRGFHCVDVSRGFWDFCEVEPFDARYVADWADDAPCDDDGRGAHGGRRDWPNQAARVASCGARTVLVVEGAMRDGRARAEREGSKSGVVALVLEATRGEVGQALEWFLPAACEYVGGLQVPIVRCVRDVGARSLLDFLEFVPRAWLGPDPERFLELAARRLGFLSGSPSPAEPSPDRVSSEA